MKEVIIKLDWNQYCCHGYNFQNLQEDIVWFWDTEELAYKDYLSKI